MFHIQNFNFVYNFPEGYWNPVQIILLLEPQFPDTSLLTVGYLPITLLAPANVHEQKVLFNIYIHRLEAVYICLFWYYFTPAQKLQALWQLTTCLLYCCTSATKNAWIKGCVSYLYTALKSCTFHRCDITSGITWHWLASEVKSWLLPTSAAMPSLIVLSGKWYFFLCDGKTSSAFLWLF